MLLNQNLKKRAVRLRGTGLSLHSSMLAPFRNIYRKRSTWRRMSASHQPVVRTRSRRSHGLAARLPRANSKHLITLKSVWAACSLVKMNIRSPCAFLFLFPNYPTSSRNMFIEKSRPLIDVRGGSIYSYINTVTPGMWIFGPKRPADNQNTNDLNHIMATWMPFRFCNSIPPFQICMDLLSRSSAKSQKRYYRVYVSASRSLVSISI
jgi:hypothetical protein